MMLLLHNPNGFAKTTARWLSFFRSNYTSVILKYRTAIEYVHCYKLAVQKSFKVAEQPENKQVLLSVETFYSLFITICICAVKFGCVLACAFYGIYTLLPPVFSLRSYLEIILITTNAVNNY